MTETLTIPPRDANPDRVEQVKSDAERIAQLEAKLQELLEAQKANAPAAPHGYLANGDEVPDASHPYDNPAEYKNQLVLVTGEVVGTTGVQSTSHWSRKLQRDVPVAAVL